MAAPAFSIQSQKANRVADPALREGLLEYARRRLPAAEVEDLVQNTLTDALLAENPPSDATAFRRWVHGIARHKIADRYRRRGRLPVLGLDVDQRATEASPSTGELRQWIESELPRTDGARATLHWLLREGDGESLEEIARDVDLPAPCVRQRVSRLRRHLHARWLALGAAGLLLLLGSVKILRHVSAPASAPPSIAREPETPLERARGLRQTGLSHCAAGAFAECIAALDRAQALDPNGEDASAIRDARAAAASAERTRRSLPGNAPPAATDGKFAPQNYAPRKSSPKNLAPSKPEPKQGPPVKSNPKPSKLAPPFDAEPNGGAPASNGLTKKR